MPKLRFPEFTEEWERQKISNILEIKHGKDYKNEPCQERKYPVMGTGGVITYIDSFLCNWDCVCIGRKGTINKPIYMEKPFWSVDTLFYTKTKGGIPKFQYYLFEKINWLLYNEASGVPSLSAATINNIDVAIPSVNEQKKIVDFLSLIDLKITKQQQIIYALKSYKRGVLNDIFSQKISFSLDEIADWQSVKISDCLSYEQPQKYIVNSENYSNEYLTPVLTANKAFILGYTNELDGIYKKGNVIIYDDFTMDTKYVDFDFKVKSSTIKILTPKKDVDLYFMYNYFQYLNLVPEGHQRSYISIIEPMVIKIPNYDIQKQIAAYLYKIDLRLKNQQEQLIKMSNLKNGLLQQMFI